MINYSIVMRSVNANLLEINQAKSRINQAKKEGTTPDPKDLELVKTEKQNAFAISQYTDIMTIEKFAKHITSHGSVYSRADISAILYIAVDCMREMLLEGKKIRLGDLGDFSLLLTSKGAEDADKFTSQNITGVKVQWEPGQEFKNLRDDAEFNLVASRSAQAAVIKAIKEGRAVCSLCGPGLGVRWQHHSIAWHRHNGGIASIHCPDAAAIHLSLLRCGLISLHPFRMLQ